MANSVSSTRKDYAKGALTAADLPADPMALLETWLSDAQAADPEDYNAMVVSTKSLDGGVNSRVVLLRDVGANSIRFFTNYTSEKGKEITAEPEVSCLFFWKELERQVRIRGTASASDSEVSDAYFNSRPKQSQIGAWASLQSSQGTEEALKDRIQQITAQYANEPTLPRPEHWGGFDVEIREIEFWQGRPSRLHNRFVYKLNGANWQIQRLDP